MSEIKTVLQTFINGRTFMKIDRPTSQLQDGDYIVIKTGKCYIQLPQSDTNYRLYTDDKFTHDGFIDVLAQGDTHLFITNYK
jgi:hypothetical protein